MRTDFRRVFLLLFCFIGSTAQSAPVEKPRPSPSPASGTTVVAPVKPWSIDWYNRYQFSLHAAGDAQRSSSVNSTLVVKYATSSRFLIQGAMGATQAIHPALEFKTINPEFRGFWKVNPEANTFKFYLGPTLALPFGTDAMDESLVLGAGVAGRALADFREEDGTGFLVYYDLTFNKNFHRYETSVFAQVNNQFSLNHVLVAEYHPDARWTLSGVFGFSSMWSYANAISNNYSLEQEVDYQVSQLLTLYVSHIRGGDFLAPNGRNYSFGIFDRDASRLSLGVILSF